MKLRIGIDGGGTKTECVLVDETGSVVEIHVGAASNPSVVGAEQATSIVTAVPAEITMKGSAVVCRTATIASQRSTPKARGSR